MLLTQVQATVRYVSTSGSGSNTGLSWATATNSLQAAINNSSAGDEIWIKAGTYTTPFSTSFTMKNGVLIFGGFAGNETLVTQRNWRTNVVTLQGNNASVITNNNISSSARLDGVTISNGRSTAGGGMYNSNSSPIIANVTFENNQATYNGGGMFAADGNPWLTNVIFRNNVAGLNGNPGRGGGMYNDEAYPNVENCFFYNNVCTKDGGAVYNYVDIPGRKPLFTNCVFANNRSTGGAGGAIMNEYANTIITNCTFLSNSCTITGCGGAVHNYSPNGTSPLPVPVITNSIFRDNFIDLVSSPDIHSDVISNNANTTITYCYLSPLPAGAGNVAATPTSPFVNMNDLDGPDNVYMTSDDGLRLNLCSATDIIDKGNNAAISLATDGAGQTRKINNGLVTDGGAGSAPIVDMGAYEQQTSVTALQLAGSLTGAHTIPTPQELATDYVSSLTNPDSGMTIRWQRSTDNVNWANASPASSNINYQLPALTQTTWYRRVASSAAYCNFDIPSNAIQIKVVEPNGKITGRVTSRNGTGVNNVNIKIKRIGRAPVSGTDSNYTYAGVTDGAGYYTIEHIYYGDPAITSSRDTFRVTPEKTNHNFDPATFNKILTQATPQPTTPVDFVDTTVFSITGRTYQECTDCVNESGGSVSLQTCELDGVTIWKNNAFNSTTAQIGNEFGQYGITVTDPVQVIIEPRFSNHSFSPAFRTLIPTENIPNQDFKSTTRRTISGYVRAGCSEYIGTAELEFSDVLPNDNAGNPRNSCFRKRITTNAATGFYSIELPARKYRVKVISFTAAQLGANSVIESDVRNFINNQLPADSLIRDITTHDTTLNLTFERAPQLKIMAGLDTLCNGTNRGFAIFRQAFTDSFRIKAFQGSPTLNGGGGCPVTDTTNNIRVYTSIQANDNTNQQLNYKPLDTGIVVRLKGGTPNIIAPYLKTLNIQYTDRFGRLAPSINKNVVVTGVKTDVATFTTVSPQIPMLVLHDPPGDNSFST